MSLRTTISGAVNTAFDALGDLVTTGTLNTKRVSGFDFGAASPVSSDSSTEVEVVIYERNKKTLDGYVTLGVMRSGIDLTTYDSLVVSGVTYKIQSYVDNDFVIMLTLSEE